MIRVLIVLLLLAIDLAVDAKRKERSDVPVVFSFFDLWGTGQVQVVLLNIELATLTNNVVLITDAEIPCRRDARAQIRGPLHP